MLKEISKKNPILLYSDQDIKHEDGSNHINLNFLYLTELNIPNLILFIYKQEVFIFTNTESIIPLIKKKLGRKKYYILKLEHIYTFDFSKYNKILTLQNSLIFTNLKSFNLDYEMLDNLCFKKRIIKSKTEIENIRISCTLTNKAINKMWKDLKKIKPKTSLEIISHIIENLNKQNITKIAYTPICSNGRNSTILHYNEYDNPLPKKSLILLDIGFKYNGYCSDITRTFPLSGKFTLNQKKIYNIVLNVQKLIIKKLKPNIKWNNLEKECYLTIFIELEKIKLINKNALTNTEKIDFIMNNIMYHSLGHFIGLKTHDIGEINILKEGMVLTIEPGIYFPNKLLSNSLINQKELKKYFNIGGIRIEDTILITKKSSETLSKINLAKETLKIEKIICS